MTTRYLLPCPCGRKIPVEPRHAGGVVRCDCGASLDVPTLLGMADLERAEPTGVRPARPWGARENVVMLGMLIFLTAVGLAVHLFLRAPPPPPRPESPTAEAIRSQMEALSPAESLHAWEALRTVALVHFEVTGQRDYEKELLRWRLWMGVVVAIGLVGVGLITTPLLRKRRAGSVRP